MYYVTNATFRLCGQRMTIKITPEDEGKNFQVDPMYPEKLSCMAANAYWALCTLAEAGKIQDLDFCLAPEYEDEDYDD